LANNLTAGNKYPGLVRTLTLSAHTEAVNGTKVVGVGTAVSVGVIDGVSVGEIGCVSVGGRREDITVVVSGGPEGVVT
jgi:hypothetical protein